MGRLEVSSCCWWFSDLNLLRHRYNFLGYFFRFGTSQDGWLSSGLQIVFKAGRKKKAMVSLYIFYPKRQSLPLSPWQTLFALHWPELCPWVPVTAVNKRSGGLELLWAVERRRQGRREWGCLSVTLMNGTVKGRQDSSTVLFFFHCFYNAFFIPQDERNRRSAKQQTTRTGFQC